MKRREFLKIAAAGVASTSLFGCSSLNGSKAQAKPNIVVIYVDDVGYEDISIQGCKDFTTPNIDRLARESVRCTNGYVMAPACGPSRASFITGRYQGRFGYDDNRCITDGVPQNQIFLPEMLRSAGYATGHIGKWHLGNKEGQLPLDRGFAESYTYNNKGADADIRDRPDWYGQKACDFIESHKDETFFLYLAVLEAHTSMAANEQRLERVKHIKDKWRRLYAAMVLGIDDTVGKVMGKLTNEGLDENTLVFFINDNGGSMAHPMWIYDGSIMPEPYVYDGGERLRFEPKVRSNDPLRSGKGELYEGGIRVPYFVRWTGTLLAGELYDRPVTAMDVFPTTAAVAKASVPVSYKLDGTNLIPYLKGDNKQDPHEYVCWRKETANGWWKVIRKGDWKLSLWNRPPELYNLAEDIGESENMADKHPEIVNELTTLLEKWDQEVSAEVASTGFKALSLDQWVLEDKKRWPKKKSKNRK